MKRYFIIPEYADEPWVKQILLKKLELLEIK